MDGDPRRDLDPYRSPASDTEAGGTSAGLTVGERAVLLLYYEHRDRPFTIRRLAIRMLPNWCLIAVLIGLLVAVVFFLFPRGALVPKFVLVGALGALTGAIVRDVGVANRLVTMWPVLREVFDWKKIAEKLDDN